MRLVLLDDLLCRTKITFVVSHGCCYKTRAFKCSVNLSGLFIFFNKTDWNVGGDYI